MFDWVPIQSYAYYYFQILLVVMTGILLHSQLLPIDDSKNKRFIKFTGILLFFFTLLYIGLRPINGVFIDMKTYAETFEQLREGYQLRESGDFGFNFFIKASSKTISVELFFFICAVIYILPLWLLTRKLFPNYWFYAFYILVTTFSFWAYGTNGVRNGMATSLFLFSFYFFDKKWLFALVIFVSISFHQTMTLPALAFGLTLLNNKPKYYIILWLVAIPLSIVLGGFWETFFEGLGFGGERTSYLTEDEYAEAFSNVGFRWDFLLYSATAVFTGYYYIYKKNFQDKLYHHLFNIYLVSNAFWILVIRASFSNRFAYLSWFMIGLVIIYPILKQPRNKLNNKFIGKIILLYFMFTYLMNVILTKK